MPRAVNGTYTLPAGNPVVTATVISSVWANTTLSDIGTVLTASLDRSGNGAMLAALKLFDGAIGAPGLTWSTETTSGLYRAAANDFRFSVAAADILRIQPTGLTVTGVLAFTTLRAGDGSAGIPAWSFTSDTDTGIYRPGNDRLRIVTGGVTAVEFDANHFVQLPDGSAALPALTFQADTDTGIYRLGANDLGLTAGGALALELTSTPQALLRDGLVGTPALAFRNDPDTGLFSVGANDLAVVTGGVTRAEWTTGAMVSTLPILNQSGGLGSPAYSFSGDSDTGWYISAPNALAASAGGTFIGEMRLNATAQLGMADGAVGTPAFSFSNDYDTGLYRIGANNIGVASAGGLVLDIGPTVIAVNHATTPTLSLLVAGTERAYFRYTNGTVIARLDSDGQLDLAANNAIGLTLTPVAAPQTLVLDGTNALPSKSFISDPDTGIYRIGVNQLGIATGGTQRFDLSSSGLNLAPPLFAADGAVGGPTYSFTNDTDTGIYRIGTNQLGMSSGNSLVMDWVSQTSGSARVADYGGTLQTVGYRNVPQNIQAANYNLVLADAGKHIYHASGAGAGDTYTIPANSSVAYDIGTVLTFVNNDSNAVSIAITTDTMTLAGSTTTGTRTLAQNGIATAIKTTATTWLISGTGLT